MLITLADFESHVDHKILQRGRAYFGEGRVGRVGELGEGDWVAPVEGTADYAVEVHQADEGRLNWSCTCPYDGGPICKHVVAVLYALRYAGSEQERSGLLEGLRAGSKEDDSLRALLEARSREELIDLLLEIAAEDEGIAMDLKAAYSREPSDRQGYLRLARESLRMGEDRHGFLDYWGAARAASGLDTLLERGERLLDVGDVAQAVHLAQAVFEAAVEAVGRADDSMGRLGDCAYFALDLLYHASRELPSTDRRELLSYCLARAPESPYRDWDWGWDLARLASALIESQEDRYQVFEAVDLMAGGGTDRGSARSAGWGRFDAEQAALIKLSVVRRMDGETAGLDFIRDHIHLDEFRKLLIEHHSEREEWSDVRRLCRERLENGSAVPPGLRIDYLTALLQAAQAEGDDEEMVRRAEELFLGSQDFGYFELLKESVADEDWDLFVDDLLEKCEQPGLGSFIQAEILAREGRWERLLELALASGDYLLNAYRDALEPRYPDRVCRAYEGFVFKMLEQTSNRATYAEAADYLRRMQQLGKAARADEIVEELCTTYRNRPAMIDELRKV